MNSSQRKDNGVVLVAESPRLTIKNSKMRSSRQKLQVKGDDEVLS
jgi:hypothetical protein